MRLLGLDPGLRHTGWGIIHIKDDMIERSASGKIARKDSVCISEGLNIISTE